LEPLAEKPNGWSIELWLLDVEKSTNANPPIRREWISVAGEKALRVINKDPDGTESENIYLIHGVQTFAVRANNARAYTSLYKHMIHSLKFSN
jgi:hypothetical protein